MNKVIKNIFKVFILVLLVLGLYKSNLDNSNIVINAETEENIEEETEQEEYSEGLEFKQYSSGYSVSKGTCTDTEVVIPEIYNGLPVIMIESAGFINYITMTTITIPKSISRIDSSAFVNCQGLESVYYGGIIEDWCKIQFLDGNCNPMKYANEIYMKNAENEFYEVKEVEIPEDIYAIGTAQFLGFNLTELKVPNNITKIGYFAFQECTNLSKVVFEEDCKIETIGNFAFYGCISLIELTLPNSLKDIGVSTFSQCTSLKSISLPNDITTLGSNIFSGCSLLEEVFIPNGVKTIEYNVFQNCESLKEVTIPSSVTSIGNQAFYNCRRLTTVYYNGAIENWCNISFYSAYSNPMIYSNGIYSKIDGEWEKVTSIEISDDVQRIGDYAFYNCTSLKNITFEEGSKLTSIGESAFYNCTSLTNITIPSSVARIGAYAFQNCTSLANIIIPSSVISIEDYAFNNCTSLADIIIPSSVISIGMNAFYNCTSLTNITFEEGSMLTSIGSSVFRACKSLTNITIPNSVTSIGIKAFYNCTSLTNITMHTSVKSIEKNVFGYCLSLEKVYYEGTIEDWCNIMFNYFDSNPMNYASHFYIRNINNEWEEVTEIEIPSTIASIGDYQFYEFENITNITIPSSVTSIGSSAFYYCSNLKSITNYSSYLSFNEYLSLNGTSNYGCLFKNVTKIIDYVSRNTHTLYDDYSHVETFSGFKFKYQDTKYTLIEYTGTNDTVTLPLTINGNTYDILNLTGIKHLIIPEGFTSISNQAFYECDTLESITIPSTLESIGDIAFSYCTNLKWVKIDSEVIASSIESVTSCGRLSEYPVTYIINNNLVTSLGTYIINNYTYINEDVYNGYTVYSKHSHNIDSGNICKLTDSNVYCSECNIEFMNLKINSAYINLNEDINMVYRTTIPNGYSNFYMVFTFMDKYYKVSEYFIDTNGRYCFKFKNIMPQYMNENISAKLYATVNGEEVFIEQSIYSIKQYCVNQLNKLEDNETNRVIRTLISDLLEYGAAVQVYRNYDIDNLVTKDLTLSSSIFETLEDSINKQTFIGEASEEIKWHSAGLYLENSMSLRLGFKVNVIENTNIEDLKVIVSINGRVTTYNVSELEIDDDGVYRIYYRGVYAREFNDTIEAYFLNGEDQIGNTLQYSINTYIYKKQEATDEALVNVIKAVYNYGASTKAYEESK